MPSVVNFVYAVELNQFLVMTSQSLAALLPDVMFCFLLQQEKCGKDDNLDRSDLSSRRLQAGPTVCHWELGVRVLGSDC